MLCILLTLHRYKDQRRSLSKRFTAPLGRGWGPDESLRTRRSIVSTTPFVAGDAMPHRADLRLPSLTGSNLVE